MPATIDYDNLYAEAIHWMETNGPRIIIAAIVFVVGQGLIRLLKKWLGSFMNKKDLHSSIKPFLQSLIVVILQILLLLIILQILGIQLTIFAAGIASLGVTVGLALSGTLQNFASGILILLLKPFKVGDNIVAQSQDGIVSSIQIFYTVVVTSDNKTVIIPNSKLSNEVIVNVPLKGNKRINFEMKFSYSEDMEKIEKIISDAIVDSSSVAKDPPMVINVKECGNAGFTITAQFWTDTATADKTQSEIHKKIVRDLKAAGVKLID
jgi:small conductance mechanosensitive channel